MVEYNRQSDLFNHFIEYHRLRRRTVRLQAAGLGTSPIDKTLSAAMP
jgi:hypothetical protein